MLIEVNVLLQLTNGFSSIIHSPVQCDRCNEKVDIGQLRSTGVRASKDIQSSFQVSSLNLEYRRLLHNQRSVELQREPSVCP